MKGPILASGARSDASSEPKPPPRPLSPWVTTPVPAFIGSFLGLGGLFVLENVLRASKVFFLPDPMLAVGSFAAVATLLYAAPSAPLGKPWNLFYGHFLAICISIGVWHGQELCGWHPDLSIALSPSLSIAVMVQQKVVHPPAAACAFIFARELRAHAQPLGGAMYLLVPGLLGCAYMLLVQFTVHRATDALYYNRHRLPMFRQSEQPDDAGSNTAARGAV